MSSLVLWPWWELADRSGLGREWAMHLAGLEERELRDPDVHVDQRRANRLAAIVTEHYGPDAALAAAEMVEGGHFNLVEMVVRSAPTVADGLGLGAEFLPLIHRGRPLVHTRVDGASILRWVSRPDVELHPGYIELLFAVAIASMSREAGCRIVPRRVWFEHAASTDMQRHRDTFGPEVHFDMPETLLELSAQDAARPLVRANDQFRERATAAARDAIRGGE
jgi:hypothetical protein